jgi:hypothetical protein
VQDLAYIYRGAVQVLILQMGIIEPIAYYPSQWQEAQYKSELTRLPQRCSEPEVPKAGPLAKLPSQI